MKRIICTFLIIGGILAAVCLSATNQQTTSTYSIWHAKTASTAIVAPTLTPVATVTRVINKVPYTITVNKQSLGTVLDGYTVTITSGAKTYLNTQLTKTEAQHVITLVQTYKPSSIQTLIARIIVLALF